MTYMNIRQKRVFVKNVPWRFDSGAAKQRKFFSATLSF